MNVLVTGGAGFIGCHTALRFAQAGSQVTLLDNLSRKGAESNLNWVQEQVDVALERVDVRDEGAVDAVFQRLQPEAVIHLAGQVAVTSSVVDPRLDFETNALGTLNILEATRKHSPSAALIFASTNKVYGGMESAQVELRGDRYAYVDLPDGVPEKWPLDFHSPYGCSKGAADQYVRDYSRIYGLRTAVFRQSCIFGTRQFGVEDQGWVAWFTIAAVMGHPITIYGDGKQIRDLLWVEDLVELFRTTISRIDDVQGEVFNVGGGPTRALSLLETLAELEKLHGSPLDVSFADWRPGDQRIYISDPSRLEQRLNWSPTIEPLAGLRRLYAWVDESRSLFSG